MAISGRWSYCPSLTTIASAMPTSVNSAVIAEEYKNYPEFAAQVVLFSTIISAFTVSLVIYLAGILF